ncbi:MULTISPECIES: FKBP-type peptidyl-prolyl cis-trans isomerase [unclassified Flavobacterium]|jgi:FKBP-type peptidyl-prolyl cis-trans isomerase FkpA|uniref:FKBP-type peptidyl-prolyl cis-trans isomerase n=1 Tax=unclassified Flavobacterium TaxID=196869 RepID=UPI0012A7E807|nr:MULTISPECIES: FKBP-type peptidyl-prolyl cis-trans isomerase [unclassified Flavobacterium]MBF4486452.1 FKBP-type peptidyl-prolyl cis-trans isomerase [Flavobacterium sp. CSZ]QGK72575.1 peptidylprolyl isomerase [Flavobacterium sp. SLB02]
MKYFLTSLLALTLFISCSKDDQKDYSAENDKEIADYIAKKNLTAQKTESGLYYVIDVPGTGTQPTAKSNVTVAYRGTFTDGTVFDQSSSDGLSFNLSEVIPGWTEGIPFFKTGGSGILLVPSRLAYGNDGRGKIPGGAVLIFDIKLIKVN